jgi:hypothetical protein
MKAAERCLPPGRERLDPGAPSMLAGARVRALSRALGFRAVSRIQARALARMDAAE